MALLVTGASGHVGGEIVRQAAARDMDVIAVHRGNAPPPWAAGLSPRVQWLACELADASAVSACAAAHGIDACIHAAAVSNEAFARPAPLAAIASNVGATASLLEAARMHAWRRFVLVSTGSVFQMRTDLVTPIQEDEPVAPKSIYATTKASAEMLTRMYRTEYGLPAATVRISWVFGPPVVSDSPARGPIPSYLLRTLRGEPVREGGGDFAASFTYVADAAAGLLAAACADELRHDVYHLGHGVNFTAREAAHAVMRAVPGAALELSGGTEPWTRYTSMRAPLAGDRLKQDTGFVPATTLDAAIARYADWMRASLHAGT